MTNGKLDLNGDNLDDTLLDALNYTDGTGTRGAARTLLRAAIAGLLNAVHPSVNYQLTKNQVISQVNYELAYQYRPNMINLANQLESCNSLTCPLN
jgi:hypothetical protein